MVQNLSLAANPVETAKLLVKRPVEVFSTCPTLRPGPGGYSHQVRQVARWSESAGCAGILVYTDNSTADPWLVSQEIIRSTSSLCPLVAIQPVYMHPYSVAKMVSTIGCLYGRRVFLNMVAGGFSNDLAALNDSTPHDVRYQRLVEYTQIIQQLLGGKSPVTYKGQFYSVTNLTLTPALPPDLRPEFMMSGSSDAGLAAARTTGAIAVQYPEPPDSPRAVQPPAGTRCGIRIGIITRPEADEAWRVAMDRFPEDRKGQLTRQLAVKVSDSSWHRRLSEIGRAPQQDRATYWLHPFNTYQTNCPYLVGDYESVAEMLAHYVEFGYRTFILDIPVVAAEFEHTAAVFRKAKRRASL